MSLLKNYSERKVNKIVDAMQVEEFLDGDCITRWVDFIDLNIAYYGVDHIIKRKSVFMKEVHVTESLKNSIIKPKIQL